MRAGDDSRASEIFSDASRRIDRATSDRERREAGLLTSGTTRDRVRKSQLEDRITEVEQRAKSESVPQTNLGSSSFAGIDNFETPFLNGSNVGDIMYWDGNRWNKFARPTGDGTYALTNTSAGVLAWTIIEEFACPA